MSRITRKRPASRLADIGARQPARQPLVRPRSEKKWLLAGTALAGGVLALGLVTPQQAFACADTPNHWTCTGSENAEQAFTATANGFIFDLGTDVTPYNLFATGPTLGLPAFQVTVTNGADGTIELHQNSSIETNEDGAGLRVSYSEDGSDVTVNVDGPSAGDDGGLIIGNTNGIEVDGNSLAGSISINNAGHVEGDGGAALRVNGEGGSLVANVVNSALTSMIGTPDGVDFFNMAAVTYDNSGGLTAGLVGNGLNAFNIFGAAGVDDAVDIKNRAGVFAGSGNGLRIQDVGGSEEGNVRIDNSGIPEEDTAGGLIVGLNEDGIQAFDINGSVTIINDNTQQGGIDFTTLDPQVFNSQGESGLLFGSQPAVNGFTTGIWGGEEGILLGFVERGVGISNVNGRIVGRSEEGIFVTEIGSDVNGQAVGIDNHGGGLVWGGGDGIGGAGIRGNVVINNTLGTIYGSGSGGNGFNEDGFFFGDGDGILLGNVSGNVDISNRGGLTFGYGEDGIDLIDIRGRSRIVSGGGPGGELGMILGQDEGIFALSQDVDLQNFSRGAILGNGSNAFFDPVIFLATNGSEGGSASVYNAGLMSSYQLPYFQGPDGDHFNAPNVPVVGVDYDQLVADASDIAQFVSSAGSAGSLASMPNFALASSLNLLQSEGGSLSLLNDVSGVMIGRISAFGSNGGVVASAPQTGNTIVNFGKWFTTDSTEEGGVGSGLPPGNILSSGAQDSIYNLGLIQTAFKGTTGEGGPVNETTTFFLDDFYNGGRPGNLEETPSTSGLLSMIDGAAGDVTNILGNYHGASQAGFTAYLGVDVNFAGGVSDLLHVQPQSSGLPVDVAPTGGNIDGSTGIIIHKVNGTHGNIDSPGIKVVWADKGDLNPASQQCFGRACKDGDTFFIAQQSSNYVNVNGIGVVQDGINAWYLTEQEPTPGDPVFDLKGTLATWTGQDLAGLATGAQQIWFDTSGVVEDHIYGNHFPAIGSGGGGADLAADDQPVAPGEAAAKRYGMWARISGNWANRDSSVADSVFGTVDTSSDQSTFSVLGGADFSPNGLEGGFRFGILGGYVTSNLDYAVAPESADYKGGLLGGYAAYTSGGFYADTQLNWSPLDVSFHTAFADVDTNVSSVGVLANTGYRMDRGRYFVEPIASLTYVTTNLDDVTTGGAAVSFTNGESLQGGVGGRLGTNFATSGGTTTEISLLGKLWNEFEDANQVTVSQGGNVARFSDNIGGLFGEVSASATIFSADRGMSAFVAGGAKFNDDFTSWNAKAGVRRNF